MKNIITFIALAITLLIPIRTINAQSWTQFTPSADTRIVYVSSSLGNDANSGLSTNSPKRSLAAASSLIRNGFPDWLLLRSGDSWTEAFPSWNKSGRSSTEVLRIGKYGLGPRPILFCGFVGGFYSGNWSTSLNNFALSEIAFIGQGYDGTGNGVDAIAILGNGNNILLEDIFVQGFETGIVIQSDPTTQILTNIKVRYSISVDNYRVGPDHHPQGIYVEGINGLVIEDCLFDHNGWNEAVPGAIPTIFRHNIYIQSNCSNVVTRRIISARAGATGMQQRPGGLAENHLFLQNPLNIVIGGASNEVRNCVVIDSRDIDPSTPRGVGIDIIGGGLGTHFVFGNICMLRTTSGTWNIVGYAADNTPNTTFKQNICWQWKSPEGNGEALWSASSPIPTLLDNNFEQVAPIAQRSISTYLFSLGRSGGLSEFLAECRLQSKDNWRPEFTALAVNNYIRGSFYPPCVADFNTDGSTNVADFTDFLQAFARGDLRTNVDHSTVVPVLNVGDFTVFLQQFARGCQQ